MMKVYDILHCVKYSLINLKDILQALICNQLLINKIHFQDRKFQDNVFTEQETTQCSVNKYTALAPIKNFLLSVKKIF